MKNDTYALNEACRPYLYPEESDGARNACANGAVRLTNEQVKTLAYGKQLA